MKFLSLASRALRNMKSNKNNSASDEVENSSNSGNSKFPLWLLGGSLGGLMFAVAATFIIIIAVLIHKGIIEIDFESNSGSNNGLSHQVSVCDNEAAKLLAKMIFKECANQDLFTQLSMASIVLNNAKGSSYDNIYGLTDNNYQGFSSYKDLNFEEVVSEDYQGRMLYIAEMVLTGEYALPNNMHLQASKNITTDYGTVWTYVPANPYDVYFGFVGDNGLESTDIFGNTLPEEAYSDVESSVNYYKKLADGLELDDYSDYTLDSVCISEVYMNTVYSECKSIVVAGVAYSLEDYVAGVISAEAYTGESMEALKAQAIAARTYAIYVTNNCSSSIANSTSAQTFDSNFDDRAIQAANETAGMVLVYSGNMFKSEYDSHCYQDGDCPDSICKNGYCSVTYTKLPNGEKHVVSVPSSYSNRFVPGEGHGRGMSQLASYYLASEKGYNYTKLLNYFYSEGVQIANLTTDKGGTASNIPGFVPQITPPLNMSNTYYFSNNNIFYAIGNRGQCTWYAYGRFNEILNLIGSNKRQTVHGHAKFWFDENTVFPSSTDVTKPKVGAIIVWAGGSYGHVAIVEAVNADGTIDYSEANQARTTENPDGFKYNSHVKLTSNNGEKSIQHRNSWNTFVGYIYPA